MSISDSRKTQPIKTVKAKPPRLQYTTWERIIFIGVSTILIIGNAVLWIGLVTSIGQTVGGAWARIILNIGIAIISFMLLLYAGFLFLFSRRSIRGIWIVWGLLIASLIIGGSIGGGVLSGLKIRMQTDQQQRVTVALEHFNYGVEALNKGNLSEAKTQFLYVNQLVPGFPGLVEKLTDVEMKMAMALTPIATPTPAPIAIPTGGSMDEYYNSAKQAIQAGDWASAFGFLEAIRNIDLNYKQVELDADYYLVLRNWGVAQIKANNLETGIYHLTLAQKFAPLDLEALQQLNFARGDIERNVWLGFASGFIKMGNDMATSGQPACDILKEYQTAKDILTQHNISDSITIPGDNEDLNTKINGWFVVCHPPTPTRTITPTPTPTLPEALPPTETPTETPTA
jgi:hypothetical protein